MFFVEPFRGANAISELCVKATPLMLIGLGLRDETCPPSSVLAAAHEIKSQKELVLLPKSGHQNENGSQEPYNQRCYGVWLTALRQGKPAPVEQAR